MQIAKFSVWVSLFAVCGVAALHAADTPKQATARVALLKLLSEQSTNLPVESAAQTVTDNPAQAKARIALSQALGTGETPAPAAAVTPVAAPPMTKEQKLHALLVKYKANQITPRQYHEQRAALIAQP
jgi:hypothetical protein